MKIYLAMITVCTLFLSGCSRNNDNTSNIDQTDLQKQQIVIKQNKKKWHQQTNQVAQSTLSTQEMPPQKNLSLAQLKKNSDFIVQGTVINFSHSHKESTETSIYINHVISGSEDILGKNIEVKLPGGIEENIYYKSIQCPLPKLGQKIIFRLDKNHNKYEILAPNYNFWIEKNHEFVLNNKKIQKEPSLEEITQQLNQAIPYRYTDLC